MVVFAFCDEIGAYCYNLYNNYFTFHFIACLIEHGFSECSICSDGICKTSLTLIISLRISMEFM